MILKRDFYRQNATVVAPALIGQRLVRILDGQRLSGIIVETEAYTGHDDTASHSHRGRTTRNAPMWGEAGYSYLYLIYGMYWLLNVSCEAPNAPAAVLIRALAPQEGLLTMRRLRGISKDKHLTNGPGKLTIALGLDKSMNQIDMTDQGSGLWIEQSSNTILKHTIASGPRVGLGKNVNEPWRSIFYRWWLKDNPFVST